ncbi:hypothetical protein Gotri_018195 [Gossypium trilobum]|uniref:Protein kinase domain-containing protein n=1 Tax=Gossypium trilobum TaxID=34281 RepID=A0A7J9E9I4_9ROSI|nr:hypothetical protein [Gossypium trilobum]
MLGVRIIQDPPLEVMTLLQSDVEGQLSLGSASQTSRLTNTYSLVLDWSSYKYLLHFIGVKYQLLGYCIDGSSRILAYEFHLMAHCMIFSMVWRKGVEGAQPCPVLTWAQREKITVVAAKGLEYLHEKADPRIIHCDGKSCNVLVFDDVANIADCIPNIAARLHLTRILGTVGYHAPEL